MNEPFSSWVRAATRGMMLCGLLSGAGAAWAQAVSPLRTPEASSAGFELPRTNGALTYSLGLSEGVSLGYSGNDETTLSTSLFGHVGFLSSSEKQPFSLVYSGGYQAATGGQSSSIFHNLGISQVLLLHRFSFVLSDSVSYLPSNPVSGLSGVPGLGDQGLAPLGQDGPQLLSQYSPRVTNMASGSASYALTGVTSVSGSGSYGMVRTTGSSGVESNTESGGAGVTHRLNALTAVSGNYSFSRFSYLGYPLAYNSQGATIEYTRQWTRNLSTDFSVGPQYSTSTGVAGTLNYTLNALANYLLPRGTVGVSLMRGTNSGSGVTLATRSTSASLLGSRRLGNVSAVSVNLSYSNNSQLPTLIAPQTTTDAVVAGVQASRSLSRTLSAYASYTLQRQLPGQGAFTVNALNGTTQTLGFGVTYAPGRYIFGK